MFNTKTIALVCLLFLAGYAYVTQQQFNHTNSALAVIQANQVKLVVGQALENATLSMIHGTAQESFALQQKQAADTSREAHK